MNTKFFIVIVCLNFILLGCMDTKFNRSDITETDQNGNLIGNVDDKDWSLQPISKFSKAEKDVFYYFFNSKYFGWLEGKNIKTDCNTPQPLVSIVAYPNPTKNNGIINL